MKLLEYVKTRGAQRELAAKLVITPVLISQWANESRPVPPDRCVEIERATDGVVGRRDLRPDDWQRIWPELIPPAEPPDHPRRRLPDGKNVMSLGTDQPPTFEVKKCN